MVVGVKDDELSEKLQSMPVLTLDQATVSARQYESAKQAQAVVRDTGNDPKVDVEVEAIRRISRYQVDK